jgi:hypothetical protein
MDFVLVATRPRPKVVERCGHAIPHCPLTNKYRRCSHPTRESWGNRGPANVGVALTALLASHPPPNNLNAAWQAWILSHPVPPSAVQLSPVEQMQSTFNEVRVCYWHGVHNNPAYQRTWIKLLPYEFLVELYGELGNNQEVV